VTISLNFALRREAGGVLDAAGESKAVLSKTDHTCTVTGESEVFGRGGEKRKGT